MALSIFPDPVTGRYKDAPGRRSAKSCKPLLTPEEYDSAKRTTFNAFYTSPDRHRGHARGPRPPGRARATPRSWSPAAASGNFMSLAPQGMRFIGVELDRISGRIARALHPDHDIRIENFRDTRLPEDSIDAVIGNVPFADVKLDYRGQKLSLHDFFFAKSVDALKPGGVLALVTSHFTLDKQNAAIREYLADQADFLGAIRLPSDAFKREGTAVVTDIVFLRKRAAGRAGRTTPTPTGCSIARSPSRASRSRSTATSCSHPEMVLGTWSRKDTLYGGEGYSVIGNGDLAEQLQRRDPAACRSSRRSQASPSGTARRRLHAAAAGAPHHRRQLLRRRRPHHLPDASTARPCRSSTAARRSRPTARMTGKRLAALIGLRDLARRVLQSQNEGWPEAHRSEARRELNRAYDRFVAAYGPINKTTFGETADGTRHPPHAQPREVPRRPGRHAGHVPGGLRRGHRQGRPKPPSCTRTWSGEAPPVTHVRSAEEGLLVSLDQRGAVDLPFIATLYGKPEDADHRRTGRPDLPRPGDREPGRPPTPISPATSAPSSPPPSAPARPTPATPRPCAPCSPRTCCPATSTPISARRGFPRATSRPSPPISSASSPSAIQVGHLKKDAVWSVEADYAAEQSVAATSEYGTPRANGTWLLELALNMKTPVIYDTIDDGDREERVVNQEATLAAREKQKLIKERFRSWVFADPDRTERLVRLYNDTYNNLRPRLFDGSHLDFPGMNQTITLRPHQKDAVWRGMSGGNTLLAHAVGAGKTFTMAADRHEDEAGRAHQEADVRRAQPHAGAVRPRVHAALPQRQAARSPARRTSPASAASS